LFGHDGQTEFARYRFLYGIKQFMPPAGHAVTAAVSLCLQAGQKLREPGWHQVHGFWLIV